MKITVSLDTGDWIRSLDLLLYLYERASHDASVEGAEAIQRETKAELSIFPHPPHTKTPSSPGLPPGFITGELMASVRVDDHPGADYVEVGPTTDYGRIQELGGHMTGHPFMRWFENGRWYRSRGHDLPARPYLLPATETVVDGGELTGIYYKHWAEAQIEATG